MPRPLDCFEFCELLRKPGRYGRRLREELREIYQPTLEELIELSERT